MAARWIDTRPEWLKRIVRHLACPDQVPQRLQYIRRESSNPLDDLGKEGRSAICKVVSNPVIKATIRTCFRWRPELRSVIGNEEADSTIVLAERFATDPNHLAGSQVRVQVARIVVVKTRVKDLAFQNRRRDVHVLLLFDYIGNGSMSRDGAGLERRRPNPLPREIESRESRLVDRLDFMAQAGEGLLAEGAEDTGITPLQARTAGTKLAFDYTACLSHLTEDGEDGRHADTESGGGLGGSEGAVCARVAGD